jgi:hypothetical protein
MVIALTDKEGSAAEQSAECRVQSAECKVIASSVGGGAVRALWLLSFNLQSSLALDSGCRCGEQSGDSSCSTRSFIAFSGQ